MIGDASLWVSYFLPADRFHADSVTWIEDRLRAGERLTAPTLLLPEVAGAIARRSQRTDLGLEAARQLWAWPGLVIVPVDEPVMLLAHQLAAGLLLKGADAVYVAVATLLGVPLITWDTEQLARGRVLVATRSPRDPA